MKNKITLLEEKSVPILHIGEPIRYNGKKWTIASVLFIGERYYMLIDKDGTTVLVPSSLIEPQNGKH